VLDDLQSLCVTLQNHAFLAKEWLLLPDLRREAKRTHPELLGEQSDILEIHSLGDESLYYAGERVAIPLRRLVEVVAYFLEFKAVSLSKLLSDVFPDEKPRSAKSYFHQCRHQLKEYLPSVQIEFDREARLYRLRSQVDIVWDVAEVRAGRRQGELRLVPAEQRQRLGVDARPRPRSLPRRHQGRSLKVASSSARRVYHNVGLRGSPVPCCNGTLRFVANEGGSPFHGSESEPGRGDPCPGHRPSPGDQPRPGPDCGC
jgi:hypothetical protein